MRVVQGIASLHRLVDGKPVLSCLTLAVTARDRNIMTIEEWQKVQNFIRFNKPSSNSVPCSAVFAHLAWFSVRKPC